MLERPGTSGLRFCLCPLDFSLGEYRLPFRDLASEIAAASGGGFALATGKADPATGVVAVVARVGATVVVVAGTVAVMAGTVVVVVAGTVVVDVVVGSVVVVVVLVVVVLVVVVTVAFSAAGGTVVAVVSAWAGRSPASCIPTARRQVADVRRRVAANLHHSRRREPCKGPAPSLDHRYPAQIPRTIWRITEPSLKTA